MDDPDLNTRMLESAIRTLDQENEALKNKLELVVKTAFSKDADLEQVRNLFRGK